MRACVPPHSPASHPNTIPRLTPRTYIPASHAPRARLRYDSSVDMWALGVVTYMLLSGKRPFHHQDKREKASAPRHPP